MEAGKDKEQDIMMELPIDPHELVSDDDEIDYSIKPEFYDPLHDEKDELWVHKKRKGRISDAVLSCPACFTTLCLDCQRHEKYVTQFRAMFVFNCKIKSDQILRQRNHKLKKTNSSIDADKPTKGDEKDALFRPVFCSVCSTEVGVYDEEEGPMSGRAYACPKFPNPMTASKKLLILEHLSRMLLPTEQQG